MMIRNKSKFSRTKASENTKCFECGKSGLVAKTYDWDEEEVISDDEEMVEVRVMMALSNEEKLIFGKNHARNDEWVNITMRNRHVREPIWYMDIDAQGESRNQNDVKVKQIRTDNRNQELESFCDEKIISQNFSSLYTPEQNGMAERKNKTLIEDVKTMLNGLVFSKHLWTGASVVLETNAPEFATPIPEQSAPESQAVGSSFTTPKPVDKVTDIIERGEKIKNEMLNRYEIVKVPAEEVKEVDQITTGGKDFLKHQDPSLSKPIQRKRKIVELEPSLVTKILRELVIFTRLKLPTFLGYKMMAYPNKCAENQKFVKLMDEMIAQRFEKHTLLSRKAKLELMGVQGRLKYWVVGIMNFRKFLKDIDMSDETTLFKGFKDGCCVGENCGIGSEFCVGSDEEKELIRKRKRECYLSLLDLVKRVAKDPCDPAIGLMSGSSKWKVYGSEHVWKQALLAKEAMVLKVNDDLNADQSVWKLLSGMRSVTSLSIVTVGSLLTLHNIYITQIEQEKRKRVSCLERERGERI
ncbi:retrovirus-related pol polyprotein from transposon TNT 1-94 [Tanacetum coccineum]